MNKSLKNKKSLKKICIYLLFVFLLLTITLIAAEGIYSLSKGTKLSTSLTFRILKRMGLFSRNLIEPAVAPYDAYLRDMSELTGMLDDFKKCGATLGNSPFSELVTEKSRFTWTDKNGRKHNKPNVLVTSIHLRSRLFNSFDPIVFNRLGGVVDLPSVVSAFLNRYGFLEVTATTDERGDRTTLPLVDSDNIILVVGDSVAFGMLVNDDQTLPSLLQKKFPRLKFVNASVPSSDTNENVDRLKERLKTFGEMVKGVIYVHSENDIRSGDEPAALMEKIITVLDKASVKTRIYVSTQYIYRTMPDIIRATTMYHEQVSDAHVNSLMSWRKNLIEIALQAGFDVVDSYDIVNEYRYKNQNLFAGMALYVDHAHFSALGLKLIAKKIGRAEGAVSKLNLSLLSNKL